MDIWGGPPETWGLLGRKVIESYQPALAATVHPRVMTKIEEGDAGDAETRAGGSSFSPDQQVSQESSHFFVSIPVSV